MKEIPRKYKGNMCLKAYLSFRPKASALRNKRKSFFRTERFFASRAQNERKNISNEKKLLEREKTLSNEESFFERNCFFASPAGRERWKNSPNEKLLSNQKLFLRVRQMISNERKYFISERTV